MSAKGPDYPVFTREMRRDHTILIPDMLPLHFDLFVKVWRTYGYQAAVLHYSGPEIAETGLRYVHNDTCYPAILTIGQLLTAIESGDYDPHQVALLLPQTGGGCRASNYIALLRKALVKAGYGYVPAISFNVQGLERHSGFRLTLPLLHSMLYAVLYGDLLMTLVNQCKPYELQQGSAEALARQWTERLGAELGSGRSLRYGQIKANYRAMLEAFAALPKEQRPAVKVGVVGEIYVKYAPLGNNNLEQFLVNEGAEVVLPGLLDFCMYSAYDAITNFRLYGRGFFKHLSYKAVFDYACRKKQELIDIMREQGSFTPPQSFAQVLAANRVIGFGAQMGEGWLLSAEMLELADSGVKNIVCAQPFGCLPNHVCGKGMMRPVKEQAPDVNIVALDYDAGAARVNQENRLKLMLANARASE